MSLKVLLCDPDWRFVERTTRFLSAHGHQVISEPIPSEALDLAIRWKPDVVVLASDSTTGHNADILRELRNLTPRPAILLTGQLDRFDAAWRAWQQGGDELLLKPIIHAWELHTAIISAIKHASPELETRAAASA